MAANYDLPAAVDKRVRFFDGQFLQDQDFIDEQKYHLDRERRLSRLLRVTGIAEGLSVVPKVNQVTVTPGMAVDGLGRHLVVAADLVVALPGKQFNQQQGVELSIIYQETPVDMATTGTKSQRRFSESPTVAAVAPSGAVA